MNKTDLAFLKKIAKTATDAKKIAEEALAVAGSLKSVDQVIAPPVPDASAPVQSALPGQTQIWVQFQTPSELALHTATIQKLSQDIDAVCKALKVKSLRITHQSV